VWVDALAKSKDPDDFVDNVRKLGLNPPTGGGIGPKKKEEPRRVNSGKGIPILP